MTIVKERSGNYYWIEVQKDGSPLIRVAFDHEPTDEEIQQIIQDYELQVAFGGEEEWQS